MSIEKLYQNFSILHEAKDKIGEYEDTYVEILEAVKGTDKEKKLASQFIARFYKYFPALLERSIESHLDLCEDEDSTIRKQAIKDLPNLCKDNKDYISKIADILCQLMITDDASELSVIHNSIMALFKIDAKCTLQGIFSQIQQVEEDATRDKCIKFLTCKVHALGHEIIGKDAEDYIIAESKKVLKNGVTADEFYYIMDILGWTRLGKTIPGQQELVELVADQAEIGKELCLDDTDECVDRLIQCLRHALPYFSSQVPSTRFVVYICDQVIPKFHEIQTTEEGSAPQLEILKLFAELASHCGTLENADAQVEKIFNLLIEYMPLPPDTDDSTQNQPRLEFSHVECLMYIFHRLSRQCPELITKDEKQLKDFKFRLQYFARGIQGYIKKLREALHGKNPDELKSDENKIKVVALKTTSNINILIKDLFHSPPSFKSVIYLSWKPLTSAKENISVKRHTPITFGNGDSSPSKMNKSDKSQREIYQPPSGKYSNKVSSYVPSQRGRSNSWGRGWRGRGGGGGYRGSRSGRGGGGWRQNY